MRRSLLIALTLGFVGFVTSFGAHIVTVDLPFYADQVGVGVAMIGVLIAAYDFAEIIAKPIFGAIADKQGMKRTMLLGIAVFTAASVAYLFVDPRLLIAVRFAQGVGGAALSAVSLALIGVYYEQRRGQAYGVYNAIKGAGYVVSPLVGGAILLRYTFSAIFIACALIGALAFALASLLPKPERAGGNPMDDDDDDFSLKSFLAVFKERRLLPWYGVTVVNMFFVGILFGFLPVRVHAGRYPPLYTGALLSAVAASYLLIQPVAGLLADKLNPATTIRAGLALAGLCVVAIPFASGAPLFLVSLLAGAGVGVVWTNTDTLISLLAKEGKLGATMGAAGSFKELGDMVGPLLIGLLAQAFGLPAGFVICGVLGLLTLPFISSASLARL